jgi:2-hydroxychromene-2-carboxylate isomerase
MADTVKGASQHAKEKLEANTALAMQEGAFGLPWFVATNVDGEKEAFFGFDHLGHVVDFLGLEKPTPMSIGGIEGGWSAIM